MLNVIHVGMIEVGVSSGEARGGRPRRDSFLHIGREEVEDQVMRYEEPSQALPLGITDAITRNDLPLIRESIISLSLAGVYPAWTQDRIFELMDNGDKGVVISAIISLGHLARTSGRIDEVRARWMLDRVGEKFDVQGYIENALDDIEMFASGK
ncbi:hypothetical protein ACFOVU_02820 [Nocardiopsis sediminis]|uniref:HEAT repeat domain-containing protein n=1 Tax=Nocardiopsis sediminis TaxID=1778267 RepID=A0ABV8FHN2_9ACTN